MGGYKRKWRSCVENDNELEARPLTFLLNAIYTVCYMG